MRGMLTLSLSFLVQSIAIARPTIAHTARQQTAALQDFDPGHVRFGSFSSDRRAPDARGLSASLRKRACANSPRYVCLVPMVKRALLVALAGESRSISPPSLEIARRMSRMGHTTGCHLTGASSPCFVGSPDWERTRWRSRRLRQLGKSSQPIETKWADLAPVGKIVA